MAYGLRERLRVQAVDEVCAMLAMLLDLGPSHTLPKLKGRTFDFKPAYKHCGVDVWCSKFLKIAVKKPEGGFGLLDVYALPFGATGSVTSFLRVSNALAHIGLYCLDLTWSAFFDDFTSKCAEGEETNVSFYVEGLLKLLGIAYATDGGKAPDFSEHFKSLGLQFDLTCIQNSIFALQHTEARKRELAATVDGLVAAKRFTPKDLERLHGRLVWFNSFVFGRQLNSILKLISLACRSKAKQLELSEEFNALQDLSLQLTDVKPLAIRYVFTDGSYESDSAYLGAVGGVLVAPSGIARECFGSEVPSSILKALVKFSKHPIYELEVLPLLLALECWSKYLRGSPTVCYLDNEAARSAFRKGNGATEAAQRMIN